MPTTEQWLEVRAHLGEHRHALAVKAAEEYPDALKVADTPLLTAAYWMPAAPIPLTDFSLTLDSARMKGTPATLLPDGYRTYSDAMAELAAPTVFQNRGTYRLLAADVPGRHLTFGLGSYFDGIDVGEACAHEYTARELGQVDALRMRAAVGDPCDPTRRPTNVAISTLTIRHDHATGEATFFLHWRDPKRVGHAGGLYQVLPVGVFQASGEHDVENDFSLWRCMIREFAEELLGASEEHPAPIDYDGWPFAKRLTEATRVSYLEEGRVLEGLAFTEENVERFVHREPTQAAGAALLALAWQHRETLLG